MATTYLGGTAASETLNGGIDSDIIWGQGGKDRLFGFDSNDVLNSGEYTDVNSPTGTIADYLGDWLDGGNGDDQLNGGSGADFLIGGSGRNILNGGGGIAGNGLFDGGFDTAIYAGTRGDYTVAMNDDKLPVGVTAIAGGTTDSLTSIERLAFSDGAIAYDVGHDGNAGKMYRLYQAALDRTPDQEGLGWWINAADEGNSWLGMAKGFTSSDEWAQKYGVDTSNEKFLENLYLNTLERTYDQEGFDFWNNALNNGVSREQILLEFAESDENYAQVIGTIENGIHYKLFTDFAG